MSVIITSVSEIVRSYNLQNVNVKKVKDNPYDGKIDQTTYRDPELYKSSLGTPVICDLTLQGGSYTDQDGKTQNFEDVQMITILVNVSQAKKIITTEIQGRDGTVKEYIGKDDYHITINGIITGENGHYPIDEVRVLKYILDAPVAINVVSTYLQNLDIFSLVVTDYAFDQEPGGYSKQNFTINCISDVPVELQII
jgi:hypothetical protein